MEAGKLRNQVTIQSKATTFDSNGDPTEVWSTFATVWAFMQPLSGREFFEARAINPELTVRFRIRWITGITSDMRIKDEDGNLYDIQAIIHRKHRRREIEIMAVQTNEESA